MFDYPEETEKQSRPVRVEGESQAALKEKRSSGFYSCVFWGKVQWRSKLDFPV
jgi:hypothetical protein